MNFDPIFGEDYEIVAYVDDFGTEWTLQEVEDYFTVTGNHPLDQDDFDPVWADADALTSIGWGDDEDY